MKSQRKVGLGGRLGGLAQDLLPLPIAPLVASLVGPLEFRRCIPVGWGRREGRERHRHAHGKEAMLRSSVLRVLQPGMWKSWADLNRMFISFSR